MDLHQISPYIRKASNSKIKTPMYFSERVLFDYEILYVKEGEIEVFIEGRTYSGLPGDVFLFKPKQPHTIHFLKGNPMRQPHIHFDLKYQEDSPAVRVSLKPLEKISEKERSWFRKDECSGPDFPLPNYLKLRNPLVFEKMLFDIIREFEMRVPYYEFSAKGMFIQLWIYLLREWHWKENNHILTNWEKLVEVKDYLSHHYDQNVTIEHLAQMTHLSKYYFLRTFKEAFGMPPLKYLQTVRIEKAKEMVQFTHLSLTQIAEQCGFGSIHSFSRSFKRLEGVNPSFYRSRRLE